MQSNQLLIPEKIKVGFQNRQDTYTKKLAYVVYYDNKGVLRKEKSWQSWRDNKIAPADFDNQPTEGFVLNKGVGGQRQSYGWNARNEYIRVYDPRGFEFEISVANLLFILRECDCSKGKGLEGKFVYAWDKTELILLPEISEDYKNSKKFTDLQVQSVKTKDLIAGASYITKKQEIYTYLGKFDYYPNKILKQDSYYEESSYRKKPKFMEKRHIFWDGKQFYFMSDLKQIAALQSDAISPELAVLTKKYYRSNYGTPIQSLLLKDKKKEQNTGYYNNYFWFEDSEGYFTHGSLQAQYDYDKREYEKNPSYAVYTNKMYVENGVLRQKDLNVSATRSGKPIKDNRSWYGGSSIKYVSWVEPTGKALYAKLESGAIFPVDSYHGVQSKGDE